MSLINDALKRAKQAQQQHSPDAPQMMVQFRPVEPTQQVKKNNTWIWIAVVIVAGLIIGFVARQLRRGNSEAPKEAKAREVIPASPIAQEPVAPKPAPAVLTTTAPNKPAHAAVTTTAVVPKPVPQEPVVQETNAAPVVAPVIIQDEPKVVPKLQAVVYDPKRPSAIISGRSVFRGDRIGDFRVVAISQESVTLVCGGQTNVLVLGE